MGENIENIDVILTERFLTLVEGAVVFLLCVLMVHILMAYKQYRFMKELKLPGAWRAYIPFVGIFQWWDAGSVSWKWLLLIFIPGALAMAIPWDIAAWSMPLIFIIWIGLTLKAGFAIAQNQKVPKVFGYLIFLPVVKWYWLSQFFLQKGKTFTPKEQSIKAFVQTVFSLLLFILLWGGILYLSFQQSILILINYL